MPSIQLRVSLLPGLSHFPDDQMEGCVIIDTLRFTTTACQAFQAGCASIRVVESIEQAKLLDRHNSEARFVLCGERNCRPIEGFAKGNSPLEYNSDSVKGRNLIFTTTNGTRAVHFAHHFPHCLLGSLSNRRSTVRRMMNLPASHWQLICAGTDGEIAGEDVLTAGAIIEGLSESLGSKLRIDNDSAALALDLWRHTMQSSIGLQAVFESYLGGRNLVEAGYRDDIAFACQLDQLDQVPIRQQSTDTKDPTPVFGSCDSSNVA